MQGSALPLPGALPHHFYQGIPRSTEASKKFPSSSYTNTAYRSYISLNSVLMSLVTTFFIERHSPFAGNFLLVNFL